MHNNQIVKFTGAASAAAAGREEYEAPMAAVIALDAGDIIMDSREPGETPFVPASLRSYLYE